MHTITFKYFGDQFAAPLLVDIDPVGVPADTLEFVPDGVPAELDDSCATPTPVCSEEPAMFSIFDSNPVIELCGETDEYACVCPESVCVCPGRVAPVNM
jgi:hypothetical protein